MTPETFARSLAQSESPESRALGVAMIIRSLTDHDPADPFRQGWPVNTATAERAAQHVGIADPSPEMLARALELAPTVSDAMLNRSTAR
jgi:hypothetical protein